MKTVKFKLISALLLLIIAFSLTNCIISKDDKKEYDQLKARCELESQNKITVRQVFEAINARDFEKMRTFYAPEYKMTGPRLPNAYTIDSLIQYIQRDIAVFPDWKYSVENMVAQGDTVAVKIAQFGVQANEYMGIKPKANQISRAAIFITVFSNGKLKETWILQDNLGFMEQIGMQLTVKPEDKTKGKR